jgi:hypothetical protein
VEASAVIEPERRWRRPAGIAAVVGVIAILASVLGQKGLLSDQSDARTFTDFHAHSTDLLLLSIGRTIGFALLAVPLLLLFRADVARSDRVTRGLVGLMVAGPLFLAANELITWFAFKDIADAFWVAKAKAAHPEALADQLARDSTLRQLGIGVGLAGALGVSVGVFYSSLWAMRTGLLTRFVGSLGMAVAVVFLLIPFGVLLWFLILAGVLLRPARALPPAWEAGVAVPWPTPGQRAAEQLDPDVLDGQATEVSAEAEAAPPAVGALDEGDDPGPVPGSAPRRKRKRRG